MTTPDTLINRNGIVKTLAEWEMLDIPLGSKLEQVIKQEPEPIKTRKKWTHKKK